MTSRVQCEDKGRHWTIMPLSLGGRRPGSVLTTVFRVNACMLGRRIAPVFGTEVADSGFSHTL
jgi:hypothetical protein